MDLNSSHLVNKVDELYKVVESYDKEGLPKIKKAYNFAYRLHAGQVRKSGEEYIIHPINVAYTLAMQNADRNTICACLLHDVLEDTPCTYEEIKENFGTDVASLVEGVTNFSEINFTSKKDEDLANLRKILIGLVEDPRIALVKISDRLHNMRTLEFQDRKRQIAKAEETLQFYSPLATHLGTNAFKIELEDLSLKYLDPVGYDNTDEVIKSYTEEVDTILNMMLTKISALLTLNHLPSDVQIRIKHIYGVYKKLKKGKVPYDIHDLLALKILVNEIKECYIALGLIHSSYIPVNAKFKDFIANPKTNMYEALHTTVYTKEGYLVQNRIRTYDMDELNKKGIMILWQDYKNEAKDAMLEIAKQNFQFFKGIKVMNEAYPKDSDFIEHVKKEILGNKITISTSQGQALQVPEGATPVDVLYLLGDNLPYNAIMVRVNEQAASFGQKLEEYDRVQFITGPNPINKDDWEEYATTTKARLELARTKKPR